MLFNLPPKKSRYFREVQRILLSEGEEAATRYFRLLTEEQQHIVISDAIRLQADKAEQIHIAQILKEIEEMEPLLGFSVQ